jgi:hypothetical protein
MTSDVDDGVSRLESRMRSLVRAIVVTTIIFTLAIQVILLLLDKRQHVYGIASLVLISAPFIFMAINFLRWRVPVGYVLLITAASVISIILAFANTYWSIGTTANFNVALTRFDGVYFALGTLTGGGTGDIVTTSEASRAIQALQMVCDVVLVLFVVGVVIGRVSDALGASARRHIARDGDTPH